MLNNRELIQEKLSQISLHQPSYEKMKEAVEKDIINPRSFLEELDIEIGCSGLPICMLGKANWKEKTNRLYASMFDEGRLRSDRLAKNHIEKHYFAKSERCRDCVYTSNCDGLHINMIRAQGLALLEPLKEQTRELPSKRPRLLDGAPAQPAAPSLPGFAPPTEPPKDPLAILAEEQQERQEQRREKRRAEMARRKEQMEQEKRDLQSESLEKGV